MIEEFVPLESNLRILLAKNKMNMTKLSELSGVSRTKISDILDEVSPGTKIITLMKLAKPLGVTWLDLIETGD